ncbi:hypothetical protein GCM10007094_15250 [Pseudovibrio japonicus]|uniref:Uncharacterized protein n=1 Tax=Pseudovibrio japonicus TaxID=366534 RepID=A0ABQ3E6P5_9HYPH|nr:hypothetical protein GCM10007094_15250 [Pseudovibrio japonicus]
MISRAVEGSTARLADKKRAPKGSSAYLHYTKLGSAAYEVLQHVVEDVAGFDVF